MQGFSVCWRGERGGVTFRRCELDILVWYAANVDLCFRCVVIV